MSLMGEKEPMGYEEAAEDLVEDEDAVTVLDDLSEMVDVVVGVFLAFLKNEIPTVDEGWAAAGVSAMVTSLGALDRA